MFRKPILPPALLLVSTCVATGCGCNEPVMPTQSEAPATSSQPSGKARAVYAAATARPAWVEVMPAAEAPKAEDFTSGKLDMKTAPLERLVAFRKDLLARRAYDLAQHGYVPTPQTKFFEDWIDKAEQTLENRGCEIGGDGKVRKKP